MLQDILASRVRAIDDRHQVDPPAEESPMSDTAFRAVVAIFLMMIGFVAFAILRLGGAI